MPFIEIEVIPALLTGFTEIDDASPDPAGEIEGDWSQDTKSSTRRDFAHALKAPQKPAARRVPRHKTSDWHSLLLIPWDDR
jgi:hypothetical protein